MAVGIYYCLAERTNVGQAVKSKYRKTVERFIKYQASRKTSHDLTLRVRVKFYNT